ncbi:CheR family methyltransferase [Myxococcus sp. CA051A]|uniref:CheR family methyltransferase n=2 Tax=unclassified Myxococcus TaxID=2648731 RepID=UPI00353012EE
MRAFLTARTGMALSGPQIRRLDDRLVERCRGLTPHQYLAFLKSPSGAAELEGLISAVVVNKTDLFRDEVQLTDFRERVLAPLVARAGGRPLRIWSAGCSTGEEVATLLVLLAEAGASPGSTVLGTDISEAALRRACALSFAPEHLRRVPAGLRERYFVPMGSRLALVSALRERASFQVHNLMDMPYPRPVGEGRFDVIFCRNVLIYFTVESFHRTVATLADSLAPGGTLVLSASEPLLQVPPTLRVERTAAAFFHVRVEESGAGQGAPHPGNEVPVASLGKATAPGVPGRSSAAEGAARSGARDSGRTSASGASRASLIPIEAGRASASRVGREPANPGDAGRTLVSGTGREPANPGDAGRSLASGAGREPANPSDAGRSSGAGREPSSPLDLGCATASGAGREPSSPLDLGRATALGVGREPSSPLDSGRTSASGASREPANPSDAGRSSASGAGREPSSPLDSGRTSASGAGREPSNPLDASRVTALPSPASVEADLLFACVLDGAASGVSDAVAERDLRRCLSLDPDHAAARYLLGLLLEQCRRPLEAAVEYRRALESLEEGRARTVPFFLNPGRLRVACAHAAGRLSPLGGSR